MIQEIHKKSGNKSDITYSGLADVVQTNDSMEFLKGMALFLCLTFFILILNLKQKWSLGRSPSRNTMNLWKRKKITPISIDAHG